MSESPNKYLSAARRAREENNTEEAKKYYEMVRLDDPDCAEARFFYVYYKLCDGTKGEAKNNFDDLCNVACSVIRAIASSDMTPIEQEKLIADMYDKFKDQPATVSMTLQSLQRSSQASAAMKTGITTLYNMGDTIEKNFAGNSKIMETAVEAWKSGVKYQRKWYGVGVDSTFPEKYTAKIQKYDATYTMPKKAGCISFG